MTTGSLKGNVVGSTPTKSEFEALQARYTTNNSIIDSYVSDFQDVSGWIRTQPGYLPEPEPEPATSVLVLATFRLAHQSGNNVHMNIGEFKVEINGTDITSTLTNKRIPNGGARSEQPISNAFDNNYNNFLHSTNASDQNEFLADFQFTHSNSTTISIIISGRNDQHGARANGNYVTVEDRQGNLLAPQQTVNDLTNGATETFNFVYTT